MKEFIAGALLLTLLILSFVNVKYMERKTDDLSELITTAETLYQEGDRQEAANQVHESLGAWLDWSSYSHIMMRHTEVDLVTDAYYELLDALEGDEPVTQAGFRSVLEKLADIVAKERISLGALL